MLVNMFSNRSDDDNSFGPGTDLILGLVAILLIFIVVVISSFKGLLSDKDIKINQNVMELNEKESLIDKLNLLLDKKSREVSELKIMLDVIDKKITEITGRILALSSEMKNKTGDLSDFNKRIDDLTLYRDLYIDLLKSSEVKLELLDKKSEQDGLNKQSKSELNKEKSILNENIFKLSSNIEELTNILSLAISEQNILLKKRKNKLSLIESYREEKLDLLKKISLLQQNVKIKNQKIIALENKNFEKLIFVINDIKGASYFEKSKHKLTNAGEIFINNKLPTIKEVLRGENVNQITIKGYASAECMTDPRTKKCRTNDRNLDLSARRAVIVAHYLHEQGIPYECINVVGFGRGRSNVIKKWIGHTPRTMNLWDKKRLWKQTSNYPDDVLRDERRVEISAVRDNKSNCKL